MKVNIQYNELLDPIFIGYVKGHNEWRDYPVPEKEAVLAKVKAYNDIWNIWGEKIISEMESITGITFPHDVDVHVVSLNPRPFSHPLIIKSGYDLEEFVHVLIHELIHVLFKHEKEKRIKLYKETKEKFPEENKVVIRHIGVYSIMNKIYQAIGQRFDVEMTPSEINNDYIRAQELAER